MHADGRRTAGGAVPLLIPLLALLAPHPTRAQFAPPPGTASTQEMPDPGSVERDATRRSAVGERGDAVLRPGDIGRMRDLMRDQQGAAAYPNYLSKALPVPRRLNIAYTPSPDRSPEALRLWRGVATSLTFLDEAGKPWPIEAVVYDRRLFSMNGKGCLPEDGGTQDGAQAQGSDENSEKNRKQEPQPSTFFMVPCQHWTWGSFAVQLKGQPIPVTFMVSSGSIPADGAENVIDAPIVLTVSKPPVPVAAVPARRPAPATAPRPVAAAPAATGAVRRAVGQEASK